MIIRTLIYILLTVSFFTVHAEVEYAKMTSVNLIISKNGDHLAQANLLLIDDKEATLSYFDKKTNQPTAQFKVTAEKGKQYLKDGNINLSIKMYEQHNKTWKQVAQSSLANTSGTYGSVLHLAGSSMLQIEVVLTARDNEFTLDDPRVTNVSPCGSVMEVPKTPASQFEQLVSGVGTSVVDAQGMPGYACCSKQCSSGDWGAMGCCNASKCCSCGSCCSPR